MSPSARIQAISDATPVSLKLVLALVTGAAVSAGGYAVAQSRVGALDAQCQEHSRTLNAHEVRLARLEDAQVRTAQDVAEIKSSLKEINSKLDQLRSQRP